MCSQVQNTPKCPKLVKSENKERCLNFVSHKCKRKTHKCGICKEKLVLIQRTKVKNRRPESPWMRGMACMMILKTRLLWPVLQQFEISTEDGLKVSVPCLRGLWSYSSYIAEDLVQKLRLLKRRTNTKIQP